MFFVLWSTKGMFLYHRAKGMLLQCGLLYSFHLTLLDQHQTTAEHYKECFYAVWSTKFKEYFAVWSTKECFCSVEHQGSPTTKSSCTFSAAAPATGDENDHLWNKHQTQLKMITLEKYTSNGWMDDTKSWKSKSNLPTLLSYYMIL